MSSLEEIVAGLAAKTVTIQQGVEASTQATQQRGDELSQLLAALALAPRLRWGVWLSRMTSHGLTLGVPGVMDTVAECH
jgi:hypothetical protein